MIFIYQDVYSEQEVEARQSAGWETLSNPPTMSLTLWQNESGYERKDINSVFVSLKPSPESKCNALASNPDSPKEVLNMECI